MIVVVTRTWNTHVSHNSVLFVVEWRTLFLAHTQPRNKPHLACHLSFLRSEVGRNFIWPFLIRIEVASVELIAIEAIESSSKLTRGIDSFFLISSSTIIEKTLWYSYAGTKIEVNLYCEQLRIVTSNRRESRVSIVDINVRSNYIAPNSVLHQKLHFPITVTLTCNTCPTL